mgnify:CR=1 FL=1
MSANDGRVCQGWKNMHCIALTTARQLAAVIRDMRGSVIPMMHIWGYVPVCIFHTGLSMFDSGYVLSETGCCVIQSNAVTYML